MILLQCKDYCDDIFKYEPEAGSKQFKSRIYFQYEAAMDIRGNFANIGKHCVMFYRVDGKLWLKVDSEGFVVDDSMKSTLTKDENRRVFSIEKDGKTLLEFKYREEDCAWLPPIFNKDMEWLTEERREFCLFIHNILSDPEKRKTIYIKSPDF